MQFRCLYMCETEWCRINRSVKAIRVWPWPFNTQVCTEKSTIDPPVSPYQRSMVAECVCLHWLKLVYPGNWVSNHCPHSIWWNQRERETFAKSVELLIKPSVPVEMRQQCHNGLWWGRGRQSQMVAWIITALWCSSEGRVTVAMCCLIALLRVLLLHNACVCTFVHVIVK